MFNDLEKIDELVKRTNASYEDAREALEKCNGDMLEAIIYIEKQGRTNSKTNEKKCCESSCGSKFKKLIKKLSTTDLVVYKKERTLLSVPLIIAIPVALIFHTIAIIAVIIALVADYRFKFKKNNGEEVNVKKVFDKISDEVSGTKSDMN